MKTLKTLLQEITAGIKAWANASFSSGTHVHGNIANNGKLATASKVVISDSNKNITTSNVSDTELGYLSGVTSAIQTQINSKAYDADVVHTTGNETIAGIKTFASTINGTSSKAVADEDGNNIKSTYGKLAGNQTWTGSNTFTNNLMTRDQSSVSAGSYGKGINFYDSTSTRYGYIQPHVTTDNSRNLTLGADTGYVELGSHLVPYANSGVSLGRSSLRWSSVYADSYYYGTTAWGLDKANVWSNDNKFQGSNLSLQNGLKEIGSSSSQGHYTIRFKDKNSADMGYIIHQTTFLRFGLLNKFTNDAYDPNGTQVENYFSLYVNSNGTKSADILSNFIPAVTNLYNLGTSTNKWKTLNGINPGALSLPNHSGIIDVMGDIVPPTGETDVNISGGSNSFTAPIDGWLVVRHDASTFVQIYRNSYNSPGTTASRPTEGKIVTSLPVIKDTLYTIIVVAQTGTFQIKLYPCLGNV